MIGIFPTHSQSYTIKRKRKLKWYVAKLNMKLNRLVKWLEHLMNTSEMSERKLTKCYLSLGGCLWPFRQERGTRQGGCQEEGVVLLVHLLLDLRRYLKQKASLGLADQQVLANPQGNSTCTVCEVGSEHRTCSTYYPKGWYWLGLGCMWWNSREGGGWVWCNRSRLCYLFLHLKEEDFQRVIEHLYFLKKRS